MDEKVVNLAKKWLEKAVSIDNSLLEKEMDKFTNLYIAYNALYNQSSKVLASENDMSLYAQKSKIIEKIKLLKDEMESKIQSLDIENCAEIHEIIKNNFLEIKELEIEKDNNQKSLNEQIKMGDRVSAVKNIPQFLGQEELYSLLIEEQISIDKILDVIEDGSFYFSTKGNNHNKDSKKDKNLLGKIKNNFSQSDIQKQQEFNEALLSLIYAARCNMFHGQKDPDLQRLDVFNAMNRILEKLVRSILDKE